MVSKLRKQNYDFVVDLHKNAKTLFIKLLLYEDCGAKIFTYKKNVSFTFIFNVSFFKKIVSIPFLIYFECL